MEVVVHDPRFVPKAEVRTLLGLAHDRFEPWFSRYGSARRTLDGSWSDGMTFLDLETILVRDWVRGVPWVRESGVPVRIPGGSGPDRVLWRFRSLVERSLSVNPWILSPDPWSCREALGIPPGEIVQILRALVDFQRVPFRDLRTGSGRTWTHRVFSTPDGTFRTVSVLGSRTRVFGPRATKAG